MWREPKQKTQLHRPRSVSPSHSSPPWSSRWEPWCCTGAIHFRAIRRTSARSGDRARLLRDKEPPVLVIAAHRSTGEDYRGRSLDGEPYDAGVNELGEAAENATAKYKTKTASEKVDMGITSNPEGLCLFLINQLSFLISCAMACCPFRFACHRCGSELCS